MREILFRGKREYNGKWVAGSLLIWSDGSTEICHTHPDNEDELLKVIVCPETVGQFTGLTDRNGKRIFEGDIIKLAQSGKCYEVKYKSGCFCIGINWAISHEPDCEVIGNIHDNPELLK